MRRYLLITTVLVVIVVFAGVLLFRSSVFSENTFRFFRQSIYTADSDELASFLRLPSENVSLTILNEPVEDKGLINRNEFVNGEVLISVYHTEKDGVYKFYVYLNPQYKEVVDNQPMYANELVSSTILREYLSTKYSVDNLSNSIQIFCSDGCDFRNTRIIE